MRATAKAIRTLIRRILAWGLVIGGALITPLPIPVGLPMIAVGLALLIPGNPGVRRWVTRLRGRFPVTSERLNHIESPGLLKRLIRITRPRPKRPNDKGSAPCHQTDTKSS